MTVLVLILLATAVWIAGYALSNIAKAWGEDAALDRTTDEDEVLQEVQELLNRKTMLMQLIQNTTDDQEMGRIEDAEAQTLIRRYRREAVRVMKQLDALQGEPEDLERAEKLFETRAQEAAQRIAAGEEQWSAAAMRRHGGLATRQNK